MATITNEQLRLALIKAAKVLIDELENPYTVNKVPKKRIARKLNKTKPVLMYGLDGTYLKTFNSINEAVKMTNTPANQIIMSCLKKLKAGGFVWRWKDGGVAKKIYPSKTRYSPVNGAMRIM